MGWVGWGGVEVRVEVRVGGRWWLWVGVVVGEEGRGGSSALHNCPSGPYQP